MAQQVYDILKQEHRQVQQLLEQVSEKPTKRQIDQLYTMLEAHTRAEEKTLYKDLKAKKQTQEIVMEGIEEHHVADVLLKEIRKLEPRDAQCKAKLSVLKENVLHHVQEEEQKMFPQAQQIMDSEWAEKVGQQYEKQEQQLKQRYQ